MHTHWVREPVAGGVRYFNGEWCIEGLYEWPYFEQDCTKWFLIGSNAKDGPFESCEEARLSLQYYGEEYE